MDMSEAIAYMRDRDGKKKADEDAAARAEQEKEE
jgi:hypothetical protein